MLEHVPFGGRRGTPFFPKSSSQCEEERLLKAEAQEYCKYQLRNTHESLSVQGGPPLARYPCVRNGLPHGHVDLCLPKTHHALSHVDCTVLSCTMSCAVSYLIVPYFRATRGLSLKHYHKNKKIGFKKLDF